MQTFLPLPTVEASLAALDDKRLGKQRLEALVILQTLHGEAEVGWPNHPATKAWRFHPRGLALYGVRACEEWVRRGFNDNLTDMLSAYCPLDDMPEWMGDGRYMVAQRSNLIRKDAAFYELLFPDTPANLAYLWPTMHSETGYSLGVSKADGKRIASGERVAA